MREHSLQTRWLWLYIYIYPPHPPIAEVLDVTYLAKKSVSVIIAENFDIVSKDDWALVWRPIW